ncbi:MAG TPA: metallophosphoesterase [Kofleriaceae bacterium]
MRAYFLLLGFASCDRGHEVEGNKPPPPPSKPAEARCSLAPIALTVPMPKRVVAIGDLHGDLEAAKKALALAGVLDSGDHWSGGATTIIQTGDILDRGDDETKILELFDHLAEEAPKSGGAVIQLLGNHELMNAAHDFRYVTPGGQRDFDGDRAKELGPGGVWAKRLAHHNVVVQVGDTVLSHAGVTSSWITHRDEMNEQARCWLDGQEGDTPTLALTSDDSPVWTRVWGGAQVDCDALKQVLDRLHAKRMVVGHTPQEAGITSACDGALWRIDTGMSKHYGGPIQVLELTADGAKPLTP